jgi:hypothetical protein
VPQVYRYLAKVVVTVINKMSFRRTRLLIAQQLLGSESPFLISGYRQGLNNIFAFGGTLRSAD